MMNCNIDDDMYRFVYEARCSIVEKQDEIIYQAISHIGGKEFRHITIDKSKVLEALTDYVRKEKNKADFVEVVRCKDCKQCDHSYPAKAKDEEALEGWYCNIFRQWRKPDDFCSYGERKNNFKE